MTYAIVKTGGKQYRVEEGQTLLVERLREDEGAKVSLDPLMYRDDKQVLDGSDLSKVKVEAKVVGHERGPKIHVLKFKPKRGYKRRTGHRQELTRLEVTGIKLAARRTPAKKAAEGAEEKPKPARKPAARKPAPSRAKKEDSDGS
jgi:large subunit ribosomal protein L21